MEVEKVTTSKRDNLILNVDGCIGICFADLLRIELGNELAEEYINMGARNGLFVLGRSIGLMGHYLDQKTQTTTIPPSMELHCIHELT